MKRYWMQTLALFLVAFSLGCNEFIMVGVTSDVAHDYQVSMSNVGMLITAFAVTYVITTPIISMITSRFSRYRALIFTLIIFLIADILTALAPNLSWLFAARILTACVVGTIISLATIFASQIAPDSQRGLIIAIVSTGFSMATILGVPIGTAIANASSWRTSFGVIAVLITIVTILVALLLPKDASVPKIKPQQGDNNGHQLKLLTDPRVILCSALLLFITAGQYTFYTYVRPIITQVLHFSAGQLNWLLGLIGICFIIGDLLSGMLANQPNYLQHLPLMMSVLTLDLLIMSHAFQLPWGGIISIGLYCFTYALPQAISNLLFINVAEQRFPAAVDLAASLNPIFTNVGIALGSFTAAQAINLLPLAKISNAAIIYGVLALISAILLKHQGQTVK